MAPKDPPIDLDRAPPEDVAATFCATVTDEWVRAGVTDAVVCPGSRSTPMALALHHHNGIRVHVHHDERSGGFAALGLGLGSGRPAVVLTTSGTAAVELHPAVVEAHHASVPLIAVTADRPPELADVGAPQTIDQMQLFGRAVRWFAAPGVAEAGLSGRWRPLASRVFAEAIGAGSAGRPGPVHIDLAFREPLVGRVGAIPAGRADDGPWTKAEPPRPRPDPSQLVGIFRSARRGMVIAGAEPVCRGMTGMTVHAAAPRIASAFGWPLLVDARVRGGLESQGARSATVIGMADAILRHEPTAARLEPDVVLHLGARLASRVVTGWLEAADPVSVRVEAHGWIDPGGRDALRIAGSAAALFEVMAEADGAGALSTSATERDWVEHWATAEDAAQQATDRVLAEHMHITEPGVARTLLASLEDGTNLVVSSSMPVRDLEWYGRPRSGVSVFANRGANGIDGVVSTAVGIALANRRPTACLVGDIALLHDSNALIAAADRGIDLTLVVVDNDGGGIFSFLEQADDPGGQAFETLFGTPHGVDLPVLAAAHGLMTVEPSGAEDVARAVTGSMRAGGVRLVRVATDRAANVDVHREIHDAVATALSNLAR